MKIRKEIKDLKRIVIKIGSSGVSDENGVDTKQINRICRDITKLLNKNIEVILVSSGAINTALNKLDFPQKQKKQISSSQALAAIGQPLLMHEYHKAFSKHDYLCAQVLLTHEDLNSRERYLNARNMLIKLLDQKVVPVLNENDSVSYAEITMGDNDQLAAMVATMMEADLLLLLTDADGMYDRNPAEPNAVQIKEVSYSSRLQNVTFKSKSKAGKGGMEMKVKAARHFNRLGGKVIIASHQKPQPILRALEKKVGTVFVGKEVIKKDQKKNWIVSATKQKGQIEVDAGAHKAILKKGSLLPVGMKSVSGKFKRGDSVLLTYKKKPFAIGLAEYDSEDTKRLIGKKSSHIAQLLGHWAGEVIVHRNNLFIDKD